MGGGGGRVEAARRGGSITPKIINYSRSGQFFNKKLSDLWKTNEVEPRIRANLLLFYSQVGIGVVFSMFRKLYWVKTARIRRVTAGTIKITGGRNLRIRMVHET